MSGPAPHPTDAAMDPKPVDRSVRQATLLLVQSEAEHGAAGQQNAESIETVLDRTTHWGPRTSGPTVTFVVNSPQKTLGWKRLYRLARVLLLRPGAPGNSKLVFVASTEMGPQFRNTLFALVSDLLAAREQRLSVNVRFRNPQNPLDDSQT